MRITIAPTTDDGIDAGQHSATVERPDDLIPVGEVVEMFAAALRAYGSTDKTISAGFSAFLTSHIISETDEVAHC